MGTRNQIFRRARVALAASTALALCACVTTQGPPAAQAAIQQVANAIGAALPQQPGAAAVAPGAQPPQGPANPAASRPQDSVAGGKVVGMNGVFVLIDAPHPSDPRWAGKRIEDTELSGFFDKHPMNSPGVYWPRVGIKIDDYSESLLANATIKSTPSGTTMSRPALECLRFSATIWMNARQSRRVDHVVLCNTDIKQAEDFYTLGAMRNYRSLYAPITESSGQVRTMGPKMPSELLPRSTSDEIQLYGNGGYLFSALFVKMGYRGPLDGDQRVWFVSTAKR